MKSKYQKYYNVLSNSTINRRNELGPNCQDDYLTDKQDPPLKNLEKSLLKLLEKSLESIQKKKQEPIIRHEEPKQVSLSISNQETKFNLTHGNEFKHLLDPRDQVLEHNFKKIFKIPEQNLDEVANDFLKSSLYEEILNFINKFLVQSVSNIISIAFNYLLHKNLEDKEAKCFAAKNIMLNIHSIFKQVFKSIGSINQLRSRVNSYELKFDMINKIETMLSNILLNLQGHYPMAEPTGATLRMKSVIYEINRTEDQQNDLIYSSDIKIRDYMSTSFDYTSFIMKVINTAIEVVQENKNDAKERTVKQIFTEFNEQLFWSAQSDYFKKRISNIESDQSRQAQEKQQILKSFSSIFCKSSTQNMLSDLLKNLGIGQLHNDKIQKIEKIDKQKQVYQSIQEKTHKLQSLKQAKRYAIGQKIPGFVEPFSKVDLLQEKFISKHSSILRILTKWGEYLENIFVNAEKTVFGRRYPFKNQNNELFTITQTSQKHKLVKQLKEQYELAQYKLNFIKQKNKKLISQLISTEHSSFLSNVSKFSETRIVSSKVNVVLTALMIDYLSVLIHHLLLAGKKIQTHHKNNQDINLLVFRVSDIMRAKFQCSEGSFITLVKTMYLLDEQQSMKDNFKLIRIKNKLDDPANNIMINYLFMGKVQCELQLSIQQPKGKEKHYYDFSHFVYELIRGKFGAITQCAIMVTQLDPMINSGSSEEYKQRTVSKQPKSSKKKQQKNDMEGIINQDFTKTIFECQKCMKITIENKAPLNRSTRSIARSNYCKKCLYKQKNAENIIINRQIKQRIDTLLESNKLRRISEIGQLLKLQKSNQTNQSQLSYVIWLNNKEQLSLGLLAYNDQQLKHYLIKINKTFLEHIKETDFCYDDIDYMSISKSKIQSKFVSQNLVYKLNANVDEIITVFSDFFQVKKIKQEQIENSIELFQSYRLEKKIIKEIKQKTEIISCNNDYKWNTIQNIINCLVVNTTNEQQFQKLKYKKYRKLDLSKVRSIQIQKINIKKIPQWISKSKNLMQLIVKGGQISNIDLIFEQKNLNFLDLTNNGLTNVKGISKLINLQKLDLKQNKLTNVDQLASLSNLKQVFLNTNSIQNIDCLQNSTNMVKLYVYYNEIKDITCLQKLTNLNYLRLDYNKIESVQSLRKLTNLIQLQIRKNCLKNVEALTHLTNLQYLNLAQNEIESITHFEKLTKLRRLDLWGNQLTNIDNLSMLTDLRILYIQKNMISSAVGIQKLTKLQELCIFKNSPDLKIAQFPLSLKDLSLDRTAIVGDYNFKELINLEDLEIKESQPQKK